MKECEGENTVSSLLVKILRQQENYEGMLKKDVKDSHLVLCKNGLCWYHEGLIEIAHSIVVELCLNGVIAVDTASHKLLRVNGEEVSGIEHNQVLDLSDDGVRWEGDVLQNKPYGWGVLYDSENRMVYEGFRMGEVNVCYGTRYYSDIGVIEYKGEWFEGKRWGRGIHYDRNGKAVFDGEWVNDEHLNKKGILSEENQFLHNHIEELIVQDNSCNGKEWSVFDLSFLPNLRLLQVGDGCFENVKEVKLIGMNRLERVVIGKKCFRKQKDWFGYDPTCLFHLKNCERVRELKMGCKSFYDYGICEIKNVPSLEVIEMGEMNEDSSCFFFARSLELKSDSERMK